MFTVALLAVATASMPQVGQSSVHVQNININVTTTPWLSVVNTRGMGYYYSSFYQGTSCAGTPTYQEGYVTGKCLKLGSPVGASVRMDCSATCKSQNFFDQLTSGFFAYHSFSFFFLLVSTYSGWTASPILFSLHNLHGYRYYYGLSGWIINGWQLLSSPEYLSLTGFTIVQSWFGIIQTDVYVHHCKQSKYPR